MREASRATPFCWRRRAPASTSSRDSSIGARFSNKSSTNYDPRIDMAQRLKTDWILFVTVLVMMSFGVLILYSASSIMAQLDPRYGWGWDFVLGPGGGGRPAGWAGER